MSQPRPAGTDREPEGTGKTSRAVHRQRKKERLGWGASSNCRREACHGMQERWEGQLHQFLKSLQPILAGRGSSGTSEASPWEDTKEFLASFEQVAKACRWPRDQWAAHLLPALSGEAEEAFRGLEARDQENYEKVKAAILRGEALRTERQRQHFRQFCCQEMEDPRRIHNQLQELCRQWLRPERRTKEQILELLILEQFLASLPPELRSWIQARRPESCPQAVALVEDFLRSQQEAKSRTPQDMAVSEYHQLPSKVEDFLMSQQEAKIRTPQVPLKEEPVDFPVAENEPPNASDEPDVDAKLLVNGFQPPGLSPLPSPREEVGQTDGKEGSRELTETGGPLQIVQQGVTQPGQRTMLWQVLQEAGNPTDRDASGNEMGNYIKVEISQEGETETEDACRMEPHTSYDRVPVRRKRLEGRSEPEGGPPVGAGKECDELADVHWKRYRRTPVPDSLSREGGHGVRKTLSIKPPTLKRPRTSPEHSVVWNHFELDSEEPCYGICTHCKRRISRGKNSKRFSTSGLLKHLQRHHANFVPAVVAAPRTVSPTSRKAKGPALPQGWMKKRSPGKKQAGSKPSEVTRAVARMVTLNDQPFSGVEEAGFQHLLKLLAPSYKIPSCTAFSRQIVPSLYQACREETVLSQPM